VAVIVNVHVCPQSTSSVDAAQFVSSVDAAQFVSSFAAIA
jgi:hypothetical protein